MDKLLEIDAAFEETPAKPARVSLGRVILVGLLSALLFLFALILPILRLPLKIAVISGAVLTVVFYQRGDLASTAFCAIMASVAAALLGAIHSFEANGDTYVRLR